MEHGTAWGSECVGRVGVASSMDPGREGAHSDADPPTVPAAAADDLGERDIDRELERLLADEVVIGAVPDTRERLERLADELFALLRARLERHLAKVMEDVAVEAATAALRRIEPRRARLQRVSEREDDGVDGGGD